MTIKSESDRAQLYVRRPFSVWLSVLCTITFLLVSCGDSSTSVNDDTDEEIGMEPTFDHVLQIFETYCRSCHVGTRTSGVRLDSHQHVIESVGDLYGVLIVQPGDAGASPLVDKLEANPQNGARMPQGGPFLSDERIEQIKAWIDNGASNDESNNN
jgi:hypothetical protein